MPSLSLPLRRPHRPARDPQLARQVRLRHPLRRHRSRGAHRSPRLLRRLPHRTAHQRPQHHGRGRLRPHVPAGHARPAAGPRRHTQHRCGCHAGHRNGLHGLGPDQPRSAARLRQGRRPVRLPLLRRSQTRARDAARRRPLTVQLRRRRRRPPPPPAPSRRRHQVKPRRQALPHRRHHRQ